MSMLSLFKNMPNDRMKTLGPKENVFGQFGATLVKYPLSKHGEQVLEVLSFEDTENLGRLHRDVKLVGVKNEFGVEEVVTMSHTSDEITQELRIMDRENCGQVLQDIERILTGLSSR